LCVTLALGVAAAVGAFLLEPAPAENIRLLGGLIAAILLVFLWGVFRLLRPTRYRQSWVIAEFITIPLLWLALVTALGIWFAHLQSSSEMPMELLQPHAIL